MDLVIYEFGFQGSYKKSQPFFQDFSRTEVNFQGPPTRNAIAQMVHKCTFPVHQANRLLRLQVFAPSPSLHFQLTCLVSLLAAFTPHVLVFEVALHRKRIPNSIQCNLLSTPLHLQLKKIQGLFKNLHRNSRTFQDCANPGLWCKFPGQVGYNFLISNKRECNNCFIKNTQRIAIFEHSGCSR